PRPICPDGLRRQDPGQPARPGRPGSHRLSPRPPGAEVGRGGSATGHVSRLATPVALALILILGLVLEVLELLVELMDQVAPLEAGEELSQHLEMTRRQARSVARCRLVLLALPAM